MICLPLPLEHYVWVQDFDAGLLHTFPVLHRRKTRHGKKPDILDCICAFDIEASNLDDIEQAVMYIWQFQIDTELTVFGRTWEEFDELLHKIIKVLPKGCNLVCYVHNLSYEYSYLKSVYDFRKEEVFAVQRRKVLRCDMYERIEFRCSYKLSNMSLKDFCRKYQVKHQKLQDYDYNITLYPWDELTIEQLRYCQNDVLGLVEAVRRLLLWENDTLITVPLTSTGFVRRECKKIMRENLGYKWAEKYFPDQKLYGLMRRCFRGGDTCANRWYMDETLSNVQSYDRSSSYPDVLVNCLFPVTPFKECTQPLKISYLEKLINHRQRAIIMEVRLTGVKLRNRYWGDPYLTKDKSSNIINAEVMNGRILSADSLEVVITEVDYWIIKEVYEYNIEVLTWYKASKGYLPDCFRDYIKKLYRQKTELKGKAGSTPEDSEYNERLYMKSKALLNSVYGMTAQQPIKEIIEYWLEDRDFHYAETDPEQLFEKCKGSYWLPYEWGIYCTAWARYRLWEGISLVTRNQSRLDEHFSDFVYCDTDSVKYLGNADWTEYNAQRIADSTSTGAYARDQTGTIHYMGVYEQEHSMDLFRTTGSKKYAYVIDGKLSVTIAGVDKKLGGRELEARGGIDALVDGFVFREAGGLMAKYNDFPPEEYIIRNNHLLHITSNCYLCQSEYTLGTLELYKRILFMAKADLDRIERIMYNELASARDDI